MANLDLQKLMAYADNELDDVEKGKVEALIARDSQAADIVKRFKESRDLMKESYSEILDQPVPEHLVKTIRNHRSKAKVLSFRSFLTQKRSFSWPSMALAACIALIIGVIAGKIIDNQPMENLAAMPAAELFQNVLETQPTGKKSTASNLEQSITPKLTFSRESGQICREYERQSPAELMLGVACRNKEGKWITMVEIDSSFIAPPTDTSTSTEYSPAEGSPDLMAAVLAALGAQKSLTADEEQRLRERGWK